MTTQTVNIGAAGVLREPGKNTSLGPCGTVELEGMTVHHCDLPSLRTAIKDIFEQRIYHFETTSKSPLIIDGGAHIGIAALYWKKVYPNARVICYEPDGEVADVLRRNIDVNQLSDVEVIEAGLSDAAGITPFISDADGGRIVSTEDAARTGRIRTVRLSDRISGPVDLLKLNVEGQEWPVLRSLEQAGKLAAIQRIVLEYHGWPGGPQCLGDILNLLDRTGYRYIVHDFDRETNPATKPPFRIRPNAPWFCLIYAERLNAAANSPLACAPINMGDLRRVTPVSRVFGLDRGLPVDRHYIERFLECHSDDIQGRVLEIGDASYTQKFGGDRVTHSDVLHATAGNRHATIIGDLATGRGIPANSFDCIILTQTLLCIEDVRSAIAKVFRALAPGGVVLATVPGISQISRYDMQRWGDWWRFTSLSARKLFEDVFGTDAVLVETRGNVLAATAFLQGMAAEELTPPEFDHNDPDYELVITIRARKLH